MKFQFYTFLVGLRHSWADLRRPPRRSSRQIGFILVKRMTASCFLLASSRVCISSFSVSNDRYIWFWGVRVSKAWVCLHLSWRWRGSPSHWPTVFSNSSLSLHMESLYSFCYSVMTQNSTHPEESLCQKASDPVLLCNQWARKSAVCLCTEALELLKKSSRNS
jgi:hypothetical protein